MWKQIKTYVEELVAVLTIQTALKLAHGEASNFFFIVNIELTNGAPFPATNY